MSVTIIPTVGPRSLEIKLTLQGLGEAVGFNGMNRTPGAEHSSVLTLLMAIPVGHVIAANKNFL